MDSTEAPLEGAAIAPAPTPTPIDAADAVVLNILSPSTEIPGGRITFPRIHLDTKLSQLKLRIRNALQAAPAPERQRLIYRGHALLNADLTLRQVLRPQSSAEPHTDVYTLHLVLPPGSVNATATPARSAVPVPRPAGLPNPPTHPAMPNGMPPTPGVQLPQQVLAQAQAAQMMLQNQLSLIQQQLAGQQHQQQQHPNAHVHGHPNPIPGMPGVNIGPNGMHVTYHAHQGQPVHQMPNMPMPPGFGFGLPSAANFQAMMNQQQQMPHPAVAGHQTMPAVGQSATNDTHQETPEINVGERTATPNNNETDGANLAGQLPVTTRIQETIGPQGQRIRTVVRESVNLTISRHGTPRLPSGTASTDSTGPHSQGPIPLPTQPDTHNQPMRHAPMPFMMPYSVPTVPASSNTTMAWVLSSPSGPEGLLFAPGHGFFSSASQSTSTRPSPTRISRDSAAAENATLPAAVQPGGVPDAAQHGQAQRAQPLARLPHPNAIPAAQLAEENEFVNFIVGRGWLFLRLYVFTFFISQPNTWQRYALLSIATFVCMLPRQNFVQRGIAQVRRHIDALIGPPAVPARDGPVAPAQTNAGGAAAPGTALPAANLTPAENSARLLREHEARNSSMIRDVLFRLERAVAMFLASLVPGVGERHVRAREEQRREVERVETGRRTREEAERAQTDARADSTAVGGAEAGSTALETIDGAGEARERTTQSPAIEAGA